MLLRLNPDFEEELKAEEAYRRGMGTVVGALADLARRLAPELTGAYERSIEVVELDGEFYVVTKDIAGHIIEFGSINNPAFAPLRRAARAAGLRLDAQSN